MADSTERLGFRHPGAHVALSRLSYLSLRSITEAGRGIRVLGIRVDVPLFVEHLTKRVGRNEFIVAVRLFDRKELVRAAPESFRPAAGAWGRSGSTIVLLSAITAAALRPILRHAWENVAAHDLARKIRRRRNSGNQA